jgi:hypothetical protein
MNMLKGRTLQELLNEVERQEAGKHDIVVPTKNLEAVGNGALTIQVKGENAYGVRPIAHTQIAAHLGIQKTYYDKCLADSPELLAVNINHWLQKSEDNRLLRTLDGNIRAFPSDSYRPLENIDLLHAVLPKLIKGNTEIVSCQITETKLYIKAVDKSVLAELPAGSKFGDGAHTIVKTREVHPAITITNSEVSLGALSVQTGLYDGFCTNLAFFGERSLRKYHVGKRHEIAGEQLYALLSDKTKELTDKAVWAQVGDVVEGALDKAKFDSLIEKVKGSQEQKIEGDVIKVVNFAAKKFAINEDEKSHVLRHLIEGGDLSRFGLYNAVTRTAEDLQDYDRASEFERLGGDIIDLKPGEWEVLSKAA